MRPQNPRWKPKKGPGGTKTRPAGEDLQVFLLKHIEVNVQVQHFLILLVNVL